MWTPQRILVGTDLSEPAARAARAAAALARRTQGRVELVHVTRSEDGPDEALENLASQLRPADVHAAVIQGDPATELSALRTRLGADLLVLGARGQRSVRRFLLGSLADRALRRPGCPLLLVERAPENGEFKRILVGVERPDLESPWLQAALGLAHQLRAEVVLLHVRPPAGYLSDAHHVEINPSDLPKRLAQLAARVDRTVPVEVVVRRGDAANVIPALARKRRTDLVVLGAERNPSGWPGRVADRVARAGLPAVLYVWPPEESSEEFAG
jgi:nucleotide-binding universal stress UspA family protein